MQDERAFTLLELLVVITIVGVLAATAVPTYKEYRARAYDARAQSDLRSALTAQEAGYIDTESYMSCSDAACEGVLPGFRRSPGVALQCEARDEGAAFSCTARHDRGRKTYGYDSDQGLLQPSEA